MASQELARRPLKSRQQAWATALSRWLTIRHVRPNSISVASVVFSAIGAACLLTGSTLGFLTAALCIQLRLLCNLLDGMVAVEGGMRSASGEIYNDLPDRLSDGILLVAAGYAAPGPIFGPALGWSAALVAIMTAYVGLLG